LMMWTEYYYNIPMPRRNDMDFFSSTCTCMKVTKWMKIENQGTFWMMITS
jgi:hypothetical protein